MAAAALDYFRKGYVVPLSTAGIHITYLQESVKKQLMDFSHNQNVEMNRLLSVIERSPSLSWLGFSTSWLWLVLWEGNWVDLAVVIHKVDLQALGDVVWEVREVFPVLSWQDYAGHTSATGLKQMRKSFTQALSIKIEIPNQIPKMTCTFTLTAVKFKDWNVCLSIYSHIGASIGQIVSIFTSDIHEPEGIFPKIQTIFQY